MHATRSLILFAVACVGCGAQDGGASLDVILITLDTTRADLLDPGPERARLAPELDRLVIQGVQYTNARTVSPLTLPAHASMMTGLYPPRTGVRGNAPMILGQDARTLAEQASEAGYETAAFVAALALDRVYGLAQGFEIYDQPGSTADRAVGEISERPALEVVAAARRFLAQRESERPLFLWLHFFDPHAPYAPSAAGLSRAGGEPYAGELADLDDALGLLFGQLREGGALNEAVIAVVGDHGEALGEHGEPTHGLLCYDGTLRVPFFLRYPDGYRAGEVSDELVSVVDLQGTLLEAMGLAPDIETDGVSLFRRLVPAGRGLYFESFEGWRMYGWSPIVGWMDERGKYIHSGRPELALASAPEGEGLARAPDPAAVERYLLSIDAVLQGPRLGLGPGVELDAHRRRELAALGYAATDHAAASLPNPLLGGSLPCPSERVSEIRVLEQAVSAMNLGDLVAAQGALEGLVDRNPGSVLMHDHLVRCLMLAQHWGAALDVLERRAKLPPESISTHRDTAICLRELGRSEEADSHVRRSLELLIEWSERRGEIEQAERYREILRSSPGYDG
jgi:choline-sulfatase